LLLILFSTFILFPYEPTTSEKMTSSPNLNYLRDIEEQFGVGKTEITNVTMPAFRRQFFLALMLQDDMTNRDFTIFDHVRSNESWLLDPRSLDAAGNAVPEPTVTPAPVPPVWAVDATATQSLQALQQSQFAIAKQEFLEKKQQHKDMVALVRQAKALICSDQIVGPLLARHNRGTGIQLVTDTFRTVWARFDARVGKLTTASAEILKQWYERLSELDTEDYFSFESDLNDDLRPTGHQLTENQRALAYRKAHSLRKEVTNVLDMFDFEHPDESTHTLAMLEAYVRSKEALIRKGMTRSALFPSAQGMSAAASPIPEASSAPADVSEEAYDAPSAFSVNHPSPTMYTHEQVAIISLQAVQTALSAAIAQPPAARGFNGRRPPASHTYESPNRIPIVSHCDHHGIGGHSSVGCKAIVPGHPCRHPYNDSRNTSTVINGVTTVVHDATRVYGHVNCRHTPRCISAADAKRSTGPFHFPAMPGNRYQRPHSG
jgi:hypothetical protein